MPFRGVRPTELGFSLVQGRRPDKPEDALAIGLSDSLWTFVQRCWDGDRNSRPRVADVVTHLGMAAASWHGLMPPCDKTESSACISEESISCTMQHGESKTPIPCLLPIKRTTVQAQSSRGLRVSLQGAPPIRKLAGHPALRVQCPRRSLIHSKNLGRSPLSLMWNFGVPWGDGRGNRQTTFGSSNMWPRTPYPLQALFHLRSGNPSGASERNSASFLVSPADMVYSNILLIPLYCSFFHRYHSPVHQHICITP